MKIKNLIVCALFTSFVMLSHACPTCASSLGDDYVPPFFSEEFYQPRKEAKKIDLSNDEGGEDEEETAVSDTSNDQ